MYIYDCSSEGVGNSRGLGGQRTWKINSGEKGAVSKIAFSNCQEKYLSFYMEKTNSLGF